MLSEELRLSRQAVPASAKGSEAAQRVLQGLVTSVENLEEPRHALGVGHGPAQRLPDLERHARLAVNASRTVGRTASHPLLIVHASWSAADRREERALDNGL